MYYELELKSDAKTEFIEITDKIIETVNKSGVQDGVCIVYVTHTTAGVTINENADPDVVEDMINYLDKLVPWKDNYKHLEGNTAAHIKASLIGSSQHLIIKDGQLVLGTWQGVYFTEFDGPRNRKVIIKVQE